MKSLKLRVLAITLSMSFAGTASANSGILPNLHNSSVAIDSYQKFKETGANDPFYDISNYSNGYTEQLNSQVLLTLRDSQSEALDEKSKERADFMKSNIISKSEKKRDMYEGSFDSEGKFDPIAYAESYSSMIDSERLSKDAKRESDFGTIVAILDKKNFDVRSLSNDVFDSSSMATINLVNALSNDSHNVKLSVNEVFEESLLKVSQMSEQGQQTLIVASQFLADCGAACTFPEPEPVMIELEPIEEPVIKGPVYVERCVELPYWKKDYIYEICP